MVVEQTWCAHIASSTYLDTTPAMSAAAGNSGNSGTSKGFTAMGGPGTGTGTAAMSVRDHRNERTVDSFRSTIEFKVRVSTELVLS